MVELRPAEADDTSALATLLEEMDRFYGATTVEPLQLRVRQIREALFHGPPAAYALLAWHDEQLVGVASYSFLWPAVGLTKSLYLKELYIAGAFQRQGIGKLLMQYLWRLAAEHGSRLEWTTDSNNPEAQRFYRSLGVPPHVSKIFYRLEGHDLNQATNTILSV